MLIDKTILNKDIFRERYLKLFVISTMERIDGDITYKDVYTENFLKKQYLLNIPNEYLVALSFTSISEGLSIISLISTWYPGFIKLHSIHSNHKMIVSVDLSKYSGIYTDHTNKYQTLEKAEYDFLLKEEVNIFIKEILELFKDLNDITLKDIEPLLTSSFMNDIRHIQKMISPVNNINLFVSDNIKNTEILNSMNKYMKEYYYVACDTMNNTIQLEPTEQELYRTFPVSIVFGLSNTNDIYKIQTVLNKIDHTLLLVQSANNIYYFNAKASDILSLIYLSKKFVLKDHLIDKFLQTLSLTLKERYYLD